jgi:RNA 3'-terminal phosphate cyclase (GTP)
MQELSNAKVADAHLGSDKLTFIPEKFTPKGLTIDIGTAGSVTLLLQAVLLPCLFTEKGMKIKLIGGTDVNWSPSFDYFDKVIVPQLRRYADLEVILERRGYYPKGGGKVEIKIKPKKVDHIPKLHLVEQGGLAKIEGVVHCAQALADKQVGERMAQSAKMHISGLEVPTDIKVEYVDTMSIGTGITLVAKYSSDDTFTDEFNPVVLGADRLGEKSVVAEDVGKEVANSLLTTHNFGAPVDEHLADMLIPFLGLFGGEIHVEKITDHVKTNIYVVEKFLGKKFVVDERNMVIRS